MILVSFMQILGSIEECFPDVSWPKEFLNFVGAVRPILLDISKLVDQRNFFNELLGDSINAASMTILFACGVTVLLLAIPVTSCAVAVLRRPKPEVRAALFDRCIQLMVGVAFVLYPVMCLRLLKLFHMASFDGIHVLDSDPRLYVEEIRHWQSAGLFFVFFYVLGTPFVFFFCLWFVVRPNRIQGRVVDVNSAEAVKQVRHEERVVVQFGLLFTKYRAKCWWYELIDMPRKLLLTGSMVFVASGTSVQIYYGIMVALASVILLSFFMPYQDPRISFVAWVAQLCTLLTFVGALALTQQGGTSFNSEAEKIFLFSVRIAVACRVHRW